MIEYDSLNLARDLEELAAFVADDKASLKEWYEISSEVSRKIRSNPDLSNSVPEIVWHYLSDADIRMKDSDYRNVQTKSLLKVIEGWDLNN